jgi:hypothetical protein
LQTALIWNELTCNHHDHAVALLHYCSQQAHVQYVRPTSLYYAQQPRCQSSLTSLTSTRHCRLLTDLMVRNGSSERNKYNFQATLKSSSKTLTARMHPTFDFNFQIRG